MTNHPLSSLSLPPSPPLLTPRFSPPPLLALFDNQMDLVCLKAQTCYSMSLSDSYYADEVIWVMCGYIGAAPAKNLKFCVTSSGCAFEGSDRQKTYPHPNSTLTLTHPNSNPNPPISVTISYQSTLTHQSTTYLAWPCLATGVPDAAYNKVLDDDFPIAISHHRTNDNSDSAAPTPAPSGGPASGSTPSSQPFHSSPPSTSPSLSLSPSAIPATAAPSPRTSVQPTTPTAGGSTNNVPARGMAQATHPTLLLLLLLFNFSPFSSALPLLPFSFSPYSSALSDPIALKRVLLRRHLSTHTPSLPCPPSLAQVVFTSFNLTLQMTLVTPPPSPAAALSLSEEGAVGGTIPRHTTPLAPARPLALPRGTSQQTQGSSRTGGTGSGSDTYDISTITSQDMSFVGLAVSDGITIDACVQTSIDACIHTHPVRTC